MTGESKFPGKRENSAKREKMTQKNGKTGTGSLARVRKSGNFPFPVNFPFPFFPSRFPVGLQAVDNF